MIEHRYNYDYDGYEVDEISFGCLRRWLCATGCTWYAGILEYVYVAHIECHRLVQAK